MKKKGSALIVAMLLIAGVGAVAFGIGRLLFVETKTATLYENGVSAYYAAESGIEEGFLRFKFDRNAMVPLTPTNLLAKDQAQRTNLTNPTAPTTTLFSDILDNTDANPFQDKQFYDLNMSYLGTDGKAWYGHDIDEDGSLTKDDLSDSNYAPAGSDYSMLYIDKDHSAKVDLTKIPLDSSSGAKLMLLFEGTLDTNAKKCQAMTELKISIEDSAQVIREFKDLTTYSQTICPVLVNLEQNKLLPPVSADSAANDYLYYEVDLKEMLNRAGYTWPSNALSITLSIKPIIKDSTVTSGVKYGLYAKDCNADINAPTCISISNIIPGPFTSITSRGYYGGVTRTLTANIDRQSGTLYDLFDYVIFKENP